jgi:hypothetical protein
MRHRSALLLSALPFVLAGAAFGSIGSAAADSASVVLAGSLPNHYYGVPYSLDTKGYVSEKTGIFTDPVHHLIFETNRQVLCPAVVVLDSDTYKVVAEGNTQGSIGCDPFMVPPGTSLAPPVAVDANAGLLLVADNQGTGSAADDALVSSSVPVPVLRVASERTLKSLAVWRIPTSSPSGPQNTPAQGATTGVSYYAPLDEALVMVGNAGVNPTSPVLPGLSVVAYSVNASLKQGSPVVDWTLNLTQCEAPLEPQFVSAAPYHAAKEDALYVPCILTGAPAVVGPPGPTERDGVVKVNMSRTGCAAPAKECPDATTALAAVAPGVTEDAYFDAGSDRLLLPSVSSGVVEVLVYDGHLNQFLGASVVGGAADTGTSTGGTAMGLDPATGRLYVLNTVGLLLVDARRTPVTPGAVFPQFGHPEYQHASIAVLPPDAAHPTTRFFVNHDVSFRPGSSTSGHMPDFSVFNDGVAVSADVPPGAVDENTLSGPAAPGAKLQQTYSGTARGYGFHSDLVGGPGDLGNLNVVVNNVLTTESLPPLKVPLGQGNRDLLGGSVERLNIQNGSVDGRASALGIADDSTAFALQQCTDGQQTMNCLALPTCDQFTAAYAPGSCPANLPGVPTTAQPTGQEPPFPDAQCSQPGSAADLKRTYDGAYTTSWSQDSGGNWVAQQQQMSNTDKSEAHATVDCDPNATGQAWLGLTQVPASSTVTVSVAQAQSTASVSPPSGDKGVVSTVTAVAHGVYIDLGGGQSLSIAEITQTATTVAAGTAGSATATDTVTLSGVSLNGTPLCDTQCDPAQIAAAVNQVMPTQLFLDFPAVEGHYDDRFMHCPAAQVQAVVTRKCTGSPGGYLAAVEANTTEQYGDEEFNGMTADVASFLPAMRVILYFSNDGAPARTREVFDLAGVEADSERGFSALLEAPPFLPSTDLATAIQEATGTPPTSQFIPGTPGTSVGGNQFTTAATGPLGVVTRTLAGLQWLFRSPLAAMQTIGFLGVLALPIVLARRRGLDAI